MLFDRLRDVADVIILDQRQRGTGLSDAVPECRSSVQIPADSATNRERYVRLHRAALDECLGFWDTEGVDIRGYTTWESAADIDAVRQALGVERVSLLGISYGTHVALATLKRYPDRIDRLVLASPEGLDHTVNLPSRTEAYLGRLQAAIDADPASRALYPDARGLIEGVLDEVEANPVMRLVDDDPEFYHTLGRFEMQRVTGHMLSRARSARRPGWRPTPRPPGVTTLLVVRELSGLGRRRQHDLARRDGGSDGHRVGATTAMELLRRRPTLRRIGAVLGSAGACRGCG